MGYKSGATHGEKRMCSVSEYISALGFADEIKKRQVAKTEF